MSSNSHTQFLLGRGIHLLELWHMAPDEAALRVLIVALFRDVVHPERVDARRARLHLQLRVVDARLIVQEALGQVGPVPAPIQPQIV